MQEEYIGCGEISRIQKIVADSKARKLFLITGKSSFRTSGAEVALKLSLKDTEMVRFSDFEVNPQLEDALKGITLLCQFQPDLVIAVGGGSVIDMAKLVTVLSAQCHL